MIHFTQTEQITCKPTLEQLATMVAYLDDDDHAKLISLIAEITQGSDYSEDMQLQSIADNQHLTPAGRFLMSQIGNYASSEFTGNGWQPISTAPRDPSEEILATDYDSIEIIHWAPVEDAPAWKDRNGRWCFPGLWQPMPPVPSPPEES